jgi:murein DD-endopeptidase MepM/ murein hydrolase activator NlpD
MHTQLPLFKRRILFTAISLAAVCGGFALVQDMAPPDNRANPTRLIESVGRDVYDWRAAVRDALGKAQTIDLPFREAGFLQGMRPATSLYRFAGREGERLRARITAGEVDTASLFLFLLKVSGENNDSLELLRVERGAEVTYEPSHDGRFLLYVHTRPFKDGLYALDIESEPSLGFPVAGKDSRAILCPFGARRSGGARTHRGVDIFARRGTPVLAACSGFVERVGRDALGGKVVWLREAKRGLQLYYAHLDRQLVRRYTWVGPGDTLGTVGSTGNADAIAPHLHFGIYTSSRGYIDPYPYIDQVAQQPAVAATHTARLGSWARSAHTLVLRRTVSDQSAPVSQVYSHTAFHVLDSVGTWFHVRLIDGTDGYVQQSLAQPATEPFCRIDLLAARIVYDRLGPGAQPVDTLDAGVRAPVLSRYRNYLHVQLSDSKQGWIQEYGSRLVDGRL